MYRATLCLCLLVGGCACSCEVKTGAPKAARSQLVIDGFTVEQRDDGNWYELETDERVMFMTIKGADGAIQRHLGPLEGGEVERRLKARRQSPPPTGTAPSPQASAAVVPDVHRTVYHFADDPGDEALGLNPRRDDEKPKPAPLHLRVPVSPDCRYWLDGKPINREDFVKLDPEAYALESVVCTGEPAQITTLLLKARKKAVVPEPIGPPPERPAMDDPDAGSTGVDEHH